MLLGQFKIMIEKKGFWIGMSLMILFSIGTPFLYVIENLKNQNDISMLPSREYAFIFYNYSTIAQLTVYVIPLISFLIYSLSYVAEKNIGYHYLVMTRRGIKSYFTSKFICCFIGGFIVVFFPSLVNITINQMIFPDSKEDLYMTNLYSNIVQDYYNNFDGKREIIINPEFTNLSLFLNHPQIYNILMSICMSALSGTCAVISFISSFYISDKYSYLSVLPAILLLLIGKKYYEMYQAGFIMKLLMNISLDDYGKTCSPEGKSYLFFVLSIIIMNSILYILMILKSKKDQI